MISTVPTVGGGIIADELPQELPDGAWSDGNNVRFRDGYAQRITGHVPSLTTPAAAAYHVANYPIAAANWWIHATLTNTYAHNGTTQSTITGVGQTGTASDRFTSCVLGGVYAQNNQVDVPKYWGGTSSMVNLTGWNSGWRCKSLRAFKVYFLALNVTKSGTNYGSMVKWSHAADPGTIPSSWDETDPTLDAGEQDLAETPDSIVDGLPLGDSFVIYKQRSMYAVQFIGGNDIFRFSRLPGDHGMLAQNCAANTPLGHVVLTASDVVVHNGTEPQSLLTKRMRRWLFNQIDGSNFGLSFLTANHAQNEVWICFPTSGASSCNRALIWNYVDNTFAVRDLPNATAGAFGPLSVNASNRWNDDTESWNEDTTTWDQSDISQADKRVLLASTAPGLYLVDQSNRFAGTTYTSSLERLGMSFGTASTVKTLRAVFPRIDAPSGTSVTIQAGASMDAETGYVWSPPVTYTVGSTYRVDTFATGRFIGLRVSSSSSGSWRIKSMDFDFVQRGTY